MYIELLGEVNIQMVGKSPVIESYIEHEYGLFNYSGSDIGKPDFIVEFVDDVSGPEKSIRLRPPVAYDERGVFLHDPNYHVVRLDFETIDKPDNRMTCDRNFNPHFFAILLEYMVHFNLLQKGAFYCHSSAFEVNGKGILCPAWRNVGKTNILIQFLKEGARFIADDWAYVNRDGYMRSLPKRLNLLYYNFEAYPELAENLTFDFRALLEFVMKANEGKYDLNEDTLNILKEQARMRVSPYDLFNQTPYTKPVKIDYIFLLNRTQAPGAKVELSPIDAESLTSMVKSIIDFEQSYFHLCYQAFKARTGKTNEFLEQSSSSFYKHILEAFSTGAKLYEISVPSQHHSKEVKAIIENVVSPNED